MEVSFSLLRIYIATAKFVEYVDFFLVSIVICYGLCMCCDLSQFLSKILYVFSVLHSQCE